MDTGEPLTSRVAAVGLVGPWGRPGATWGAGGQPEPALPSSQALLTSGFFHPRPGLPGPPQETAPTSPFCGRPASVWRGSSLQAWAVGRTRAASLPAKPQPCFPFSKSRQEGGPRPQGLGSPSTPPAPLRPC